MLKVFFKKINKKYQKISQPVKFNTYSNNTINEFLDKDKLNKKNYKLKIITAYDNNFSKIGDITSKNMKNYSKKFNLEFEKFNLIDNNRPASWSKVQLIKKEIIKKTNDFVMWVDADAFFSINSNNILHELDDINEIFLVSHFSEVHKGSRFKNTVLGINRINCGVLVFRVSDFNLEFLSNVWKKDEYINHPWWEQAAMMDVINLKADLTGNLNDHKGNDYYLSKMKFLSKEWNSIPSRKRLSTESMNPSIIHLAGMNMEERMVFLKKYIK